MKQIGYIAIILLLATFTFSSDIPATVITPMNMPESNLSFLKGANQMKFSLHKVWTSSAPHMKHVLAKKSGHSVHYDEPQLVIDEISAIVEMQ